MINLAGSNSQLLTQVFDLISKFTLVGGGLWLIWGTVILAGALKDKNGPQLQSGICWFTYKMSQESELIGRSRDESLQSDYVLSEWR